MATHASILAWRILWTEEPGVLQSKESNMTEATEHAHSVRLKMHIFLMFSFFFSQSQVFLGVVRVCCDFLMLLLVLLLSRVSRVRLCATP